MLGNVNAKIYFQENLFYHIAFPKEPAPNGHLFGDSPC